MCENKPDLWQWFSVNVKIHLQPEYWDKQFTVTNLHTRIDSYL